MFRCLRYKQIGDWGKEALADPNREIGFGFVSCSCRACVRACEAVWVREGVFPQRWRLERQQTRLRAWGGPRMFFLVKTVGFNCFS